jgi:hypothetical protein
MPKERDAPSRKGQLAIATKMASNVKAGIEALKVKGGDAKVKGKKKLQQTIDSSEQSELEESEGEISSEDSHAHEPQVSQLKNKRREGENTKRRTKPDTPLVEVNCHFSIFVYSHLLI